MEVARQAAEDAQRQHVDALRQLGELLVLRCMVLIPNLHPLNGV